MQERCNSIVSALELCLSCTNPSIWYWYHMKDNNSGIYHSIQIVYCSVLMMKLRLTSKYFITNMNWYEKLVAKVNSFHSFMIMWKTPCIEVYIQCVAAIMWSIFSQILRDIPYFLWQFNLWLSSMTLVAVPIYNTLYWIALLWHTTVFINNIQSWTSNVFIDIDCDGKCMYMGQVIKVRLSCYLVLLSHDSKTRLQGMGSFVT